MEVKNNKLVGAIFKETENQSGVITPKFIIYHFTAAGSAVSAISWMLDPKSKVSAHLHLDKQGNFVQLVEFNKRAYHAGVSEYNGYSNLNYHSIGIEIQNRGKVNGNYEDYTESQINAVIEVSKALIKAYPSIIGVAGHEDIAMPRGRKDDPGPKFPMNRVRKTLFGTSQVITKMTTSDLNMRSGPGTNNAVVTVLKKGTVVNVLSSSSSWSEVSANGFKGWVSSTYIK
ncbi:N-acetylmuramoyl-L-alanine amidase [Sphingobacterium detergens]|uniref:N-acetylmuramoyl-L-alanine amidase n=1 Tax=Sphingobacterium detergens TaxID=1145106 RepID=UPI003AAB7C4E